MSDPIEANVTGRLMLLLGKHGIFDNHSLLIYRRAVCDAVREQLVEHADDQHGMKQILDEQLALLDDALVRRKQQAGGDSHVEVSIEVQEDNKEPAEQVSSDPAIEEVKKRVRREAPPPSGYVPKPKSMEEKLVDARKPMQTLLKEDCVQAGLISSKKADKMIRSTVGKMAEQAEKDLVEQLRQILQDRVKKFIRKSKGGPWSDPRTQEDMRQDIHSLRSVRSVLMLARQINKEYREWENEHRRGGLLGLFASRRRIAER